MYRLRLAWGRQGTYRGNAALSCDVEISIGTCRKAMGGDSVYLPPSCYSGSLLSLPTNSIDFSEDRIPVSTCPACAATTTSGSTPGHSTRGFLKPIIPVSMYAREWRYLLLSHFVSSERNPSRWPNRIRKIFCLYLIQLLGAGFGERINNVGVYPKSNYVVEKRKKTELGNLPPPIRSCLLYLGFI